MQSGHVFTGNIVIRFNWLKPLNREGKGALFKNKSKKQIKNMEKLLGELMPEKIETSPILKWEIGDILNENSTEFISEWDEEEDACETTEAVSADDFELVTEKILNKVTEFINANYIQKPCGLQ